MALPEFLILDFGRLKAQQRCLDGYIASLRELERLAPYLLDDVGISPQQRDNMLACRVPRVAAAWICERAWHYFRYREV